MFYYKGSVKNCKLITKGMDLKFNLIFILIYYHIFPCGVKPILRYLHSQKNSLNCLWFKIFVKTNNTNS